MQKHSLKNTITQKPHKSISKPEQPTIKTKSFKTVKARITRKSQRKFNIERVSKILDILPKFAKFYDKLTPKEIIAIKYYKGHGSFFQSQLLAEYNDGKNAGKEIKFPFHYWNETRFREDISPNLNELAPLAKSFDIKELPKYIETAYKARITLLNRLDKIYDRADCPRMMGDELLFRGMGMNSMIKKLKVGDKYLFKNFISTTIDRQIAENFSSGECLFVLMGMKDIPFIYMPNSKNYGNADFSKFMIEQDPLYDYSEYTLPRNLEFKIEKIEKKPLNPAYDWNMGKPNTFAKLQRVLKKQGYLDNKSNPDENTTSVEGKHGVIEGKHEVIEKNIYPQGTIYYCTLHNWHARTPIIYEDIVKNAKFVLDKPALESWSRELPRMM